MSEKESIEGGRRRENGFSWWFGSACDAMLNVRCAISVGPYMLTWYMI